MKYLALTGDERIEVDLETAEGSHIEAFVGGRRYRLDLTEVEPGVFWIVDRSRSVEVGVTPDERGYTVRIGPRRIEIRLLGRRERLRASAPGTGQGVIEVRALMPGRVVEVLIQTGARVDRGQGLFVIEAMKMQNETPSPRTGLVDSLLVGEGMAVNRGDLLATIGPEIQPDLSS